MFTEIWPRIAVFLCGIGTLYLLAWAFDYNRDTIPKPKFIGVDAKQLELQIAYLYKKLQKEKILSPSATLYWNGRYRGYECSYCQSIMSYKRFRFFQGKINFCHQCGSRIVEVKIVEVK